MKCPICKSELETSEHHDDHIMLESESKCTVCNRYNEYFAYGCTEAGVRLDTGWLTWQWENTTGAQDRGRINMEIEKAAKTALGEWTTARE